MILPRPRKVLSALLAAGILTPSSYVMAQATQEVDDEEVVNLSPFVVDTASDEGYVATQTLAGGRLNQSLKNTGAAIQVVTKDFMDDIGATGIEELLQYTTSSEVAGILGNFTGANDGGAGESSTGGARRNPDGATRVRGLAAPDRTRNFFKTDIPFDSYNTERVDINRGANSFLFGLGSPAGLINNGMAQARFTDSNEIVTRIGSGGEDPSYRASFKVNRVLVEDKLAVLVAGLTDRTQYRQRPTYKDDDRLYATLTFRPFGHQNTVIKAHYETGEVIGNAPDVLMPINNLSTFLDYKMSFDVYENIRRFNHQEGPNLNQWRNNRNVARFVSAEERASWPMYTDENGNQQPFIRNSVNANVYGANRWGNGAYGFVFDGTNGREPSFAYTDLLAANNYNRRDPFWDPQNRGKGSPQSVYPNNMQDIRGTGWLDQGFVDLETFNFSKYNLGWDNDYYTRDFDNINLSLEQVFLDGDAGVTVAWDYQDLFRDNYTAFNGANSQVMFDVNEVLILPSEEFLNGGPPGLRPNPNYGRPVVLTKSGRNAIDEQRETLRVTAFIKHDFAKKSDSSLARILGSHTLTFLGDRNVYDERRVGYVQNSFGDPDPALHITTANARSTANNSRNVPNLVYIGPRQVNAFTDDSWQLSDFILQPADYDILRPEGFSIQKLSWNLGDEVNNDNRGIVSGPNSIINGNESWQWGTFEPREVPTKNYRKQRTEITSAAINTQSMMFNEHLVLNMGYREDQIDNWINTEAPLIGIDEIPDLTDEGWRLENGVFAKSEESTFGYGGVLYWPKNIIPLPEIFNDITFHYNTSDNFIPATDRVDEIRQPVDSPRGESEDWGVSFYMMDNRLTARFNWYKAKLLNATSPVSNNYNQNITNMFTHFGNLNRDILQYDFDGDGQIDQSVIDEFAGNGDFDPMTGLNDEGLTVDQAIAQDFPSLTDSIAARAAIEPFLTDALKVAYNYRQLPNGGSVTQWAGAITDTQDIDAKGFEAEIIYNPTRSWRIAFNAAQQETVLTNIAPRLTDLLNDVWIPHLAQFGHLDWNAPVREVAGNTTSQQVNNRLVDYFAIKGNEGRANPEQREWRFNLITNYQFRDGAFKGFSIGGAARWEDEFAGGYPILQDADTGLIRPDIDNPYFGKSQISYDATIGYRRKLEFLGGVDWRLQINMRNLQNIDNDGVQITRFQPDGSAARARYKPPAQYWLTNTFRF
ncbi:MAG: hypothetical protein SynsKO_29080 [Synoicihabitans sp.]